MAVIVLDASVWLKVLLPHRETGADAAMRIWDRAMAGEDHIVEPPHWLAEVSAVLCRLSPETAQEDVRSLDAMDVPVEDHLEVYQTAVRIAAELDHHLFDTLYHAVALCVPDATLITADQRYARKATRIGKLTLLD